MEGEDGAVMVRRSEIDTRAPFRSVKEAVSLFGEKVLAGELYPNKLKQACQYLQTNGGGGSENGHGLYRLGSITAELEETKQSLEKAKEESMVMAHCISSLQEELETTKRELRTLKQKKLEKQATESETEDVKIMEDSTKHDGKMRSQSEKQHGIEFQKKRYVTFADPPSLAQLVVPPQVEKLERHSSLKNKKKKKPLIPLIGGMFFKKKEDHLHFDI